ncbi:MAG: transcriptional repressor [Chloroflexota bacterium]|nr:transcriptional repressor [Chloroflexota bacterium]NOG65611.1 transcriptional repressor [Chloroflexota bacterium]GIK66532.1 MAG: transcriptional repressor [Chloroflexota bacterium]
MAEETDPQQNELAQILHQAGYKYTTPRRLVAEVLLESHTHLSAPEVVDRVAARDTSIGRMSVYRTLDLFTRLGLIHPAFQGGVNARYVVMVGGHHHHLICQNCGKVMHFDECPLRDLTRYLESQFGFSIEGHLLEFFGRCADCRTQEGAAVAE